MVRTFVNLDASNVKRPNKKRLLCEALANERIETTEEARLNQEGPSAQQLPPSDPHGVLQLVSAKDFSLKPDVRECVETLWRTFLLGYCQTNDYWPPGCSLLALRSETLDLSLVALSAQRLSLDSPDSNLRLLSLTAYNKSIGISRSLIKQEQEKCKGLTPMLAVTSTVYALIEASLMQPDDIANLAGGDRGISMELLL